MKETVNYLNIHGIYQWFSKIGHNSFMGQFFLNIRMVSKKLYVNSTKNTVA